MTPPPVFHQCLNPACNFRFPAPSGSLSRCPHCGAGLSVDLKHESSETAPQHPKVTHRISAMLDNIRSILNVGSMFRTADGAGLSHLHLCGITATPDHPRIAKTGLGAEWSVPWTYYPNGFTAARDLISQGAHLWGLEISPSALPVFEMTSIPENLILVVGSEYAGIDPAIQSLCEKTVLIPMQGYKKSLNVAVAFGIAVYTLAFMNRDLHA